MPYINIKITRECTTAEQKAERNKPLIQSERHCGCFHKKKCFASAVSFIFCSSFLISFLSSA